MSATVHHMTGHVKPPKMSGEHALRLARFRLMAERHMENLGAAVWRTRNERELSRSELGGLVGASEKTVERWEKGTHGGLMEALPAVARELQTTADALMALAVAIGQERGDAPPAVEPEDRISRLEQKMDAVLAALKVPQAAAELEQELEDVARQSEPTGQRTSKPSRASRKK
jgi:transcriptional regulator with XRE-family HTH domain